MNKKLVNWNEIKVRWESGESPYSISKDYPVTREGIRKRANKQGWQRGEAGQSALIVARATEIVSDEACYRADENTIAVILEAISEGATESIAAGLAGVDRNTLANWKKKDTKLSNAIKVARCKTLHICAKSMIDAAANGDWKAGHAVLQVAPETREEFGAKSTIDMNVHIDVRRVDDDRGVLDVSTGVIHFEK